MKKTFSFLLKFSGVLFIILALFSGLGALSSYLQRAEHGAGLMFADAEIFVLLTIVFLFLGFISLWIGKKINA